MSIDNNGELKTAVGNWLENDSLATRIPEFIALTEDRIGRKVRIRANESVADLTLRARIGLEASEVAGTADVITFTPSETITEYVTGDRWRFTAEGTNTTTVTLDIDSVAATAVKKHTEGSIQALEAGDIVKDHVVDFYYDGTQFLLVQRGAVPLPSRYLGMRRVYIHDTPNRALEFMTPPNFWARYLSAETGKPETSTIEGDYLVLGPDTDSAYSVRMLYWRKFASLSGDSDTNWILSNARGLHLYGALLEAEVFLENDEGALKYAKLWDQALEDVLDADKEDRFSGAPLQSRTEVYVDTNVRVKST